MENKLKTLIVAQAPRMSKKLTESVAKHDSYQVVSSDKNTAEEALESVDKDKPDIVLMDLTLGNKDGVAITRQIRSKHPNVQVILLAEEIDPAMLRKAMRAGACDFLSHSYSEEELSLAMQTAADLVKEYASKHAATGHVPPFTVSVNVYAGRMVSIYSPRGGIGTSQIAANLAIAWAKEGKRVAVVDSDLQFGDIALLFNEVNVLSIADLTANIRGVDDEMLNRVMMKSANSGVFIFPAPKNPEEAERVDAANFSAFLGLIRSNFDYLVIDTSSYISEVCLAALDQSDLIVLVVNQKISTVKAAGSFLRLAQKLNYPREKILLLVNQYNSSVWPDDKAVGERMALSVLGVIPEDVKLATEAANLGRPILLENPDTLLGKAITKFSKEVAKQFDKVQETAA